MKICAIITGMLLLCSAAAAQQYSIDRHVIASGGGHSESASYSVDCTIGQPVTGSASSDNYSVEGGFWAGEGGGVGGACGYYVVGDYNGSDAFNVSDIVEGYSKLKTGSPDYPELLCDCEGDGNLWPVRMDVNNSCAMNVADIVDGYSKLKTGSPELVPCQLCPPDEPIPPYPGDGDQPLVVPVLESKAKVRLGSGAQ